MKTADEIFAAMCREYERMSGVGIADGGDMAIRMRASAAEMESLYIYADWIKREAFPQTAQGQYLDYHAEIRGIMRNAATKSRGTMRFSVAEAATGEIAVPQGTVCVNAAGDEFVTLRTAAIAEGETFCDVEAEALTAGIASNVPSGTVIFMTAAPTGVKACTNITPFSGGSEQEDDDSLRDRVLSSYRSLPTGANAAYYEKTARSVDGVCAVNVKPKNRGLGTVDIVISSYSGMPNAELISDVLTEINIARELCVDVAVLAPDEVAVNVGVTIDVENGFEYEQVKENVESAVNAYFNGELLGCDVLCAKLGSVIFGVKGVKNYKLTTPTQDIAVGADALPTLASLIVEQWG